MNDMKKFVIMMIMGVALIALPTMAQQQEWQSTSTMQTSGSSYSSQVTAVGATGVTEMATTTTSSGSGTTSSPHKAKRDFEPVVETEEGDEGSPIGDAVLPLMLMAAVFCGVIALRRKRSALNG